MKTVLFYEKSFILFISSFPLTLDHSPCSSQLKTSIAKMKKNGESQEVQTTWLAAKFDQEIDAEWGSHSPQLSEKHCETP